MKRLDVGLVLTIGTLAVTVVIWAVRLEGRLNAQEREFAAVVQQLRDDVNYIRMRLDQALDGR